MARPCALLLEDDVDLRELLLEAFASDGIQVRTCHSFEQMRAAAARRDADIVVADFWGDSQRSLPDRDRDDIRELASHLPVILLTGRTWAAETTAEELGAYALIRKPFDLDDLLRRVQEIVAKAQS